MAHSIYLEKVQEQERNQLIAREVAEQEDFATRILKSTSDGIIAYDLQFRYTIWNPVMEKMSGVSKEQALGRIVFDVFPHIIGTPFETLVRNSVTGKNVVLDETYFMVPTTGKSGYARNWAYPIRDEFGNIVGGLVVVRDVTEEKLTILELEKENTHLRNQIEQLKAHSGLSRPTQA